jgi:hypothetical protein
VTKRTLQQIEQSLRARLSEAGSKDLDNDGIPDDAERSFLLPNSEWGGTRDNPVHQIAPPFPGAGGGGRGSSAAPGGGGGKPSVWRVGPDGSRTSVPPPLRKPAMSPAEARAAAAERKRAEELLTGQTPKEGPKVWRQGGSDKGQSLPPGQYVDKSGIKRNADGTPVPTVLQVKPGAEQSGPKFDPNKPPDTGLEWRAGPGTRELWHTKPQKQPKPLKPEELEARERKSQQRYTPDLKDKRERRALGTSVTGHAAALAALLWAQKQKEKESGGSEPTGSKSSADSQAANQPVSVELLSPSANNSGSSDVDLPTVTMQPRSDAGSISEPESGSMSGRIISEPRKQVPDTELKSLPAVTVTAEPSGGAAKSDPNVKQPVNNADAEKAKAEKDRKEAEARADAEKSQREAEARAEKDRKEAEARAEAEKSQREAEKSRREAEARAEKDRKEAEARNKPAERPQSRPDSGNQEKSGAGSSDREGPGTKTSPGGTGEKPGDRSGPGTGTGTDPDYKPRSRRERMLDPNLIP